ncbi:MAG: LuxR C-terminal-related transcriptional regulator, partial [Pseudomonadota bacterium]
RLIEVRILAIRIALAQGRAGDARSLLADIAFSAPLADYRGSVLEEGPETLDALRSLCAQEGVGDTVRHRLAAVLGTPEPARPDGLTPREREILGLLAAGQTNKEIGRALGTSANTVKFHLKNLYAKLDVTTRVGAAHKAQAAGLTSLPERVG